MAATGDLPSPMVPPTSPAAPETLSAKINAGTRQIHADLNRLITARLPLSLLPHAPTPEPYLHGIHAFAQLYLAFEDAWQDIICAHLSASQHSSSTTHDEEQDRLHGLLATLVPAALWRTQRVEADLAYLTAQTGAKTEVQRRHEETSARVAKIVEGKPHVLLAYGWVMYMAIFSGGRWIRAQLVDAGPSFWGQDSASPPSSSSLDTAKAETKKSRRGKQAEDTVVVDERGFSLFCFPGAEDGEDVKTAFKARFARADDLLSPAQVQDVVEEAKHIFEMCIDLVSELDERLATPAAVLEGRQGKNPEGNVATEQSRAKGKKAEQVEKEVVPAYALKYLPAREDGDFMPHAGSYVTKGVPPFAAMMAIAFGIGGWYVLHTWGLVNHLRAIGT